jgi:hypothetical protein
MAKQITGGKHISVKRKRPGIHSKSKSSQHKGSKSYCKLDKGQGR